VVKICPPAGKMMSLPMKLIGDYQSFKGRDMFSPPLGLMETTYQARWCHKPRKKTVQQHSMESSGFEFYPEKILAWRNFNIIIDSDN
jgi:hypothetical protein